MKKANLGAEAARAPEPKKGSLLSQVLDAKPGEALSDLADRAASLCIPYAEARFEEIRPTVEETMEMAVNAWQIEYEKMERGEAFEPKSVEKAVQALHDVLMSVPEGRWQELRHAVDEVLCEVQYADEQEPEYIARHCLKEGRFLKERFEADTGPRDGKDEDMERARAGSRAAAKRGAEEAAKSKEGGRGENGRDHHVHRPLAKG